MKHVTALVFLLVACNADMSFDSPTHSYALKGDSLVAVVGPGGGELRGEKGTKLAGFLLEIPKGALSEPTELTVYRAPSRDLPPHAAPLSTMYVIEPAIRLQAPARLILPVDAGMYEYLGGRNRTAVVYGLEGRVVTANPAIANAIEIETLLDGIGPVIPALNIELQTPLCVRNRTCLQACNRGGFCALPLGNVGNSLVFHSDVAGDGLYWVDHNAQARARRFDLTTGALTESDAASASELAIGPVAAVDEALWVAGENGMTRYSFTQTTQLFDSDLIDDDHTTAVAPVRLANGEVLRAFFDLGFIDLGSGQLPELPHSTIRSPAGTFETRRATGQQTELVPHFGDSRRFFAPGFELLGGTTNPGAVPRLLELDVEGKVISKEDVTLPIIGILSGRAFTQSGRIGTDVGVRSAAREITVCRYLDDTHGCPDRITLSSDDEDIRDFALDKLSGAWVAPFGSTEIIFTESVASPVLLRHDFAQDLPGEEVGAIQQVNSIGPHKAVVLTSSGHVFYIEYQE